eukprot:scaffold48360_cov60-Phaeocystis_antarctica.AAC.5
MWCFRVVCTGVTFAADACLANGGACCRSVRKAEPSWTRSGSSSTCLACRKRNGCEFGCRAGWGQYAAAHPLLEAVEPSVEQHTLPVAVLLVFAFVQVGPEGGSHISEQFQKLFVVVKVTSEGGGVGADVLLDSCNLSLAEHSAGWSHTEPIQVEASGPKASSPSGPSSMPILWRSV